MERLTYRSPLGNAVSYGACDGIVCPSSDCDKCKIGAMISRLCAYEDTGLEPEEVLTGKELAEIACTITLLKEYQGLGKDGRLIALPKESLERRKSNA